MPRLLIASGIFHPEPGGPATYLVHLLPALQRLGWDVRAISYGSGDTTPYPYPLVRIPRRILPLRLLDYAREARPLLGWADLVYVHTLGLPLLGGDAPHILKIVGDQAWERSVRRGWVSPTTDVDDFQTQDDGPIVQVQKAVRSREVRGMASVIVPSEYLKHMVVGWGVDPARIHVIYNALSAEVESPANTQAEARARLGIDADEKIILTAARLNPWKGVDHLIAALAHVPEVRLLVAGDGPEHGALEQQTTTQKLSDRVTFLGQLPREQVALHMKAADYVALYSGYEGLSHTLLESLRAGTPVIASDKGGNPEVVTHEVNGLLVPYVDVEALAGTLHEAFQPGKRESLAKNSLHGMARFSFAGMVEATVRVLESCLKS